MNIETNTIVGADAAVAQVTVHIPGVDSRSYVGTSKKHPKDESNRAIGEQLAVARALQAASQDLQLQARVKIEWADYRMKTFGGYPFTEVTVEDRGY